MAREQLRMKHAESPLTIDSELLAQVQTAAKAANRNVSEQLVMWASLGQVLESMLTSSEISALMAGAIEIKVEVSKRGMIDARGNVDIVELAMSHQSEAGFNKVASQIKKEVKGPLYETVDDRSDLLRQISPDGTVEIGILKNNNFKKIRSV
jgi:ABC-type ATPase with predicted acetyltransferase domain